MRLLEDRGYDAKIYSKFPTTGVSTGLLERVLCGGLCVRELLGAIYRGALKVPGRSPPARGGSSLHECVKISRRTLLWRSAHAHLTLASMHRCYQKQERPTKHPGRCFTK